MAANFVLILASAAIIHNSAVISAELISCAKKNIISGRMIWVITFRP